MKKIAIICTFFLICGGIVIIKSNNGNTSKKTWIELTSEELEKESQQYRVPIKYEMPKEVKTRLEELDKLDLPKTIEAMDKKISEINLNNYFQTSKAINQLLAPFPEFMQNTIKKSVIEIHSDKKFDYEKSLGKAWFNKMLKTIAIKNTDFQTVAGNQVAKSTLQNDIYWMKKDNSFVLVKMESDKFTYITPQRPDSALPKDLYYWWSDYSRGRDIKIVRKIPNGPRFIYDSNQDTYVRKTA